ncbi:MAG: hypothetical protein ACI4N3_03900 [Alphaproteobacteria bacterium]
MLSYKYKLRRFKIIVINEESFDFIINSSGKLMLIIISRSDVPYNPFIVYDNKKTLALFRDKNEIIKLTYIPRKVLKVIKNSEEISITEMDYDNTTIRQYRARIIRDSKLKKKLKKEAKYLY